MTRAMALLVAIGMIGVATPTAGHESDCDNRTFFEQRLATTGAADDGTDTIDRLVERVGEVCMADVVDNAEDSGGLPATGDHLLVFELNYFFGQIPCANGDDVGPNGHSIHTEPVPEQAVGQAPWSYGGAEYFGVAYSDFSTEREDVYHVEAYIYDADTGKSFVHDEPIVYAGISDFWCLSDTVWDWRFVLNMPWVSGTVAPAIAAVPADLCPAADGCAS